MRPSNENREAAIAEAAIVREFAPLSCELCSGAPIVKEVTERVESIKVRLYRLSYLLLDNWWVTVLRMTTKYRFGRAKRPVPRARRRFEKRCGKLLSAVRQKTEQSGNRHNHKQPKN